MQSSRVRLEVAVPASTMEERRPWKQLSRVRRKLLLPAPGGPKSRMFSELIWNQERAGVRRLRQREVNEVHQGLYVRQRPLALQT